MSITFSTTASQCKASAQLTVMRSRSDGGIGKANSCYSKLPCLSSSTGAMTFTGMAN